MDTSPLDPRVSSRSRPKFALFAVRNPNPTASAKELLHRKSAHHVVRTADVRDARAGRRPEPRIGLQPHRVVAVIDRVGGCTRKAYSHWVYAGWIEDSDNAIDRESHSCVIVSKLRLVQLSDNPNIFAG